MIENICDAKGDDSDDRAGVMSGGDYSFGGPGVTVGGFDMASIAQHTYDAFRYDDGLYYTNGDSYYNQYWHQ